MSVRKANRRGSLALSSPRRHSWPAISPVIERLEGRQLLSAVISASSGGAAKASLGVHPFGLIASGSIVGDTYVDVNGNGAEDPGETYLLDVQVFIDTNHNGTLDSGEPVTTSGSTGKYAFSNLAPGNYQVREIAPSGYTISQPADGFYDVTLAAGQNADDDFGNHPINGAGIIRGGIFNDLNANGIRDNGEPNLPGWSAYLDLNQNGKLDPGEPTAAVNSAGYYVFQGLAPGNYRVRPVVPNGWTITRPATGYFDVTLAPSQTVTDRIFGVHLTDTAAKGSIVGTVFKDANANAARDTGEPGLGYWTVFLDTNDNGKLDPGEIATRTNTSGQYTFSNLTPGTYHLAEVLKTGWRQTTPPTTDGDVSVASGQTAVGTLFGLTEHALITGSVFKDVNGNGIQDTGENGLAGWRVYLDLNHDGIWQSTEPSSVTDSDRTFSLQVAPGTYTVRIVPQAGYHLTTPIKGYFTVTVGNGAIVTNELFGESPSA